MQRKIRQVVPNIRLERLTINIFCEIKVILADEVYFMIVKKLKKLCVKITILYLLFNRTLFLET
jgi:hypothetical protein